MWSPTRGALRSSAGYQAGTLALPQQLRRTERACLYPECQSPLYAQYRASNAFICPTYEVREPLEQVLYVFYDPPRGPPSRDLDLVLRTIERACVASLAVFWWVPPRMTGPFSLLARS